MYVSLLLTQEKLIHDCLPLHPITYLGFYLHSKLFYSEQIADDTIYLQIVPITQSGTPDKVSPWATPRASVGGKPWNGEGSHVNNSYAESSVSRWAADEGTRQPRWNNDGIEKWAEVFVLAKNLSGMLSFEVIVDKYTNEVYGMDCKPFLHSSIMNFNHKTQVS